MKLRFNIPATFYVHAADANALNLETTFAYQGLTCRLAIVGGDPLTADELPPDSRHFRQAERLEIVVSEDPAEHDLWTLIEEGDWKGVAGILRTLANRCLRGIRNFGLVPSLRELRGRPDENAEEVLRGWQVQVATDLEWRTLLPEPELSPIFGALFGAGSAQVYAEMGAGSWPRIEEAIQDDIAPPPELEFTTNAIEHLRLGNLRLALLEAIIGLEIVLTRYLTLYLQIHKGLSKNRIRQFLTPELGLSAKLAAVLDLTLTKSDLKSMNLEKAKAAVNWRNTVMHRTGNLPAGLPEETVREGIWAVLTMTELLAGHAEGIEARPDMEDLAARIADAYGGLPRPVVVYLGKHRVGVQFSKVTFDDDWIPPADEVAAIADAVSEMRRERDPRFEPNEHLRIIFLRFPHELRAKWDRGRFETVSD